MHSTHQNGCVGLMMHMRPAVEEHLPLGAFAILQEGVDLLAEAKRLAQVQWPKIRKEWLE